MGKESGYQTIATINQIHHVREAVEVTKLLNSHIVCLQKMLHTKT